MVSRVVEDNQCHHFGHLARGPVSSVVWCLSPHDTVVLAPLLTACANLSSGLVLLLSSLFSFFLSWPFSPVCYLPPPPLQPNAPVLAILPVIILLLLMSLLPMPLLLLPPPLLYQHPPAAAATNGLLIAGVAGVHKGIIVPSVPPFLSSSPFLLRAFSCFGISFILSFFLFLRVIFLSFFLGSFTASLSLEPLYPFLFRLTPFLPHSILFAFHFIIFWIWSARFSNSFFCIIFSSFILRPL